MLYFDSATSAQLGQPKGLRWRRCSSLSCLNVNTRTRLRIHERPSAAQGEIWWHPECSTFRVLADILWTLKKRKLISITAVEAEQHPWAWRTSLSCSRTLQRSSYSPLRVTLWSSDGVQSFTTAASLDKIWYKIQIKKRQADRAKN